jgi:NAD(P)-dependent dehydrogenase (short-subunit alcohol dehydrogenase family)
MLTGMSGGEALPPPDLFEGRVAVVTGSARGIGLAIARRFAAAGAAVVVADRDEPGATHAAETLDQLGGRVTAVGVDVSDATQVDRLMDVTRSTYGAVDILVNNAAHARYGFAVDLGEEEWDYTIAICLKGVFLCAQRAARIMLRQGSGKILNISSMAATVGLARTVAYAASKGGIEAMTRVMAVELAAAGIQVNAIAPGPVETEFSREVVSEQGRAARLARLPAGRFGSPNDVAGAALFLASPAADWINGAVLAVDGGYTVAGAIERRDASPAKRA